MDKDILNILLTSIPYVMEYIYGADDENSEISKESNNSDESNNSEESNNSDELNNSDESNNFDESNNSNESNNIKEFLNIHQYLIDKISKLTTKYEIEYIDVPESKILINLWINNIKIETSNDLTNIELYYICLYYLDKKDTKNFARYYRLINDGYFSILIGIYYENKGRIDSAAEHYLSAYKHSNIYAKNKLKQLIINNQTMIDELIDLMKI